MSISSEGRERGREGERERGREGERERERERCVELTYIVCSFLMCVYIYTKECYTVLKQTKSQKFPTTPYTHTHANKNRHKSNTRRGREAPGASSWQQGQECGAEAEG
jgi:hypothetical protein